MAFGADPKSSLSSGQPPIEGHPDGDWLPSRANRGSLLLHPGARGSAGRLCSLQRPGHPWLWVGSEVALFLAHAPGPCRIAAGCLVTASERLFFPSE